MKQRVRLGVCGLLVLLASGCPRHDAGPQEQAAASKAASKTASAARSRTSEAHAEVPAPPSGPLITMKGQQVLVNGAVQGSTQEVANSGRLRKIDKLFTHMKKLREEVKLASPGKPFPGKAAMVMEPVTSGAVFKSVFQSIAYAGYPNLSVKTARGFVPLDAQIPRPPQPGPPEPTPAVVHLRLEEGKVKLMQKYGAAVVRESEIPRPKQGLVKAIEKLLAGHFLRHHLGPDPTPVVVLHLDNNAPFSSYVPLIEGADAAHQQLASPQGGGRAFRLVLSVR